MGNDEILMVLADVEEGEISDSSNTSIEVKQTTTDVVVLAGGREGSNGNSSLWTMSDMLTKYPDYRGYADSDLSNFAWSQAVQNKPFNEVLGMDYESRESSETMIEDIEDEKEEGELEDGEIDGEIDLESASVGKFDASVQAETESVVLKSTNKADDNCIQKERDLDSKVKLIRGVLESTSLVEAQTAFEGVCSRLLGALESLRQLVSDNGDFPKRDTLVQLSFASLQTINSVFCVMNNISKELNKKTMSRLLSLVNDNFSQFLSSNQINEIKAMNQNLWRSAIALYGGISSHENANRMSQTSNGDSFLAKNLSSEGTHRGAFNLRSRLPLIDLHKDHDADSLPSPTRETTPSLPVNGRHILVKPGFPVGKEGQTSECAKASPYEREAFKAVSTYQNKFGRNSIIKMDDLPSPTPSGEEPSNGNADIGGEVSSSVVTSLKPGTLQITGQDIPMPYNFNSRSVLVANAVSSTLPTQSPSSYCVSASTGACQIPASEQIVISSARSRDPRLRLSKPDGASVTINLPCPPDARNFSKVEPSTDMVNPRKQKAADEMMIDGTAWKRQKSDKDTKSLCLQNPEPNPRLIENRVTSITTSVMPTVAVSVSQKVPMIASTNVASLPSLLKDIAVNPTMLLNLLKMGERQNVLEKAPQKAMDPRKAAQLPGSSVPPGVAPRLTIPASNALAAKFSKPPVLQDSSQHTPSDEAGSIRMKPRDPRRILHGSTLRSNYSVENQSKMNDSPTLENVAVKGKKEELDPPSQLVTRQNISQSGTSKRKNSSALPDISTQFTKNLKSIADMVDLSQQVGNPPAISHSVEHKTDKDVKRNPSKTNKQEEGVQVSAPSVTAAAGPTRSINSWGDVEHLFEGYDDKQRVAIQRERARRLEEQNKMFASQKLSLVLDIDHTLLNSAKFHEIEPAHEEKLRKKEEQDREKPYRHLFRFPHMGMWTRLRPGIWNFLEKASKLYELHLYTMGNNLYATEMAKLLDPKGILFNGRVISKGDDADLLDGDERVPKTKDLEGVMGMESSVVIIDDTVRVWPHNRMNLIAVERYTYFPCSRQQFGLLGPSLLEIDHDEVPEEGTLASSLAVIERIHKIFFSHTSLDEADVRNILALEQRKILAGCRILFSRIIPVAEAKPHLHPLWQLAEQFGAVCTTHQDDNVTHVSQILLEPPR